MKNAYEQKQQKNSRKNNREMWIYHYQNETKKDKIIQISNNSFSYYQKIINISTNKNTSL